MLGSALFELNWDTNAPTTIREMDLIERKVDSVGKHVDGVAGKFKRGLGGSNMFAGIGDKLGGLTGQLKGMAGQAAASASSMVPLGGAMMGAGVAAGAAVAAVAALGVVMIAGAFKAAAMADALQDMADKLGVSTDFLQIQQGVMLLTTGSADMLEKGILKLDEAYGKALGGDQGSKDKFAQLGISLTDAAGNAKSSEQIFNETTDALRGVENQSQRSALAAELFGKAGKEMGGYLGKTKEEIEALEAQMKKYSVANAGAISSLGILGDAGDMLGKTFRAGLINSFAPLGNALGKLGMSLIPIVGESFKVLGGVIDLVCGVASLLGDGLKWLWDMFQQGAAFIGNMFPIFGKLGEWLNFTGESSLSLRERWAITMGDMIKFAGTMVGRIAGFFASLAANTHNIIAGIKNALVDSGIGKLIGVNGRMEIRDARAASAGARAGVEAGFNSAGAAFTERYRGAGNSAKDAETPEGPGRVRSMGGGGSGGASGPSAAAQATQKYQEAVEKLNQAKAELNLTDEQRRVLDEMEKAGLERNIELVGERADTIRRLVGELQEMEEQKAITEAIKEYQQALLETTLSEEDLIRVEARRRAGLETDLTITSEGIRQLEESALAADRAAKAKEKLKDAEEALLDINGEVLDLQWELREARASDEEYYDLQLERIEAERAAKEAQLRLDYAGLDILEKLIEANNRLAKAKSDIVQNDEATEQADKAQEQAEELADTMLGMWDDWRATMKKVLGDFIKEMLTAIAKATILKSIMGDSKSGSSGNGSVGSMVASAVMSVFKGGRASGGPMEAGAQYIVSPGEKFVPRDAGYMLSASDVKGLRGGTSKTVKMENHFTLHGGGDRAQTLQDMENWTDHIKLLVRTEMDDNR